MSRSLSRAEAELEALGHHIRRADRSHLSLHVDDAEGEDAEQILAVAARHGLHVSFGGGGALVEVVVEYPRERDE